MVKNSIDPSRVSSDARHVTAQYSAIIFCRSVKFALSVIRSLACCRNLADPKRAGPNALTKERNSSADVMEKGNNLRPLIPNKALRNEVT